MLSTLNNWLVDSFGPFGPVMAAGVLGVALILMVLPVFLNRPEDPLAKLGKVEKPKAAKDRQALRVEARSSDKLAKYANFLEPQDAEELSALRLKLLQAGYRSKNAVRIYHLTQFILGMLFLVLGLAYTLWTNQTSDVPLTTQQMMLYTLLPGAVGYLGPKYWVTRRVAERQVAITNAFPDSLDMMLTCVEAGQSIDQAILRVAQELKSGYPDLAFEYELVSYEMKAGKEKTQVLRDMAERCGVPDISSFVTVLIQSQQFGTSIADALRVYSAEMRDKRVMRAEEAANKLPTKMTLATMMLTVPPLLIILIGPSIHSIIQNFATFSVN